MTINIGNRLLSASCCKLKVIVLNRQTSAVCLDPSPASPRTQIRFWIVLFGFWLALLPAQAQFTVYTNEASFLGAINPDYYKEAVTESLFKELTNNRLPPSRDFLSNDLAYRLSSPGSSRDGGLYPTWVGPWLQSDSDFVITTSWPQFGLLLTNFSPNVSAVGGNFFPLNWANRFTNTPISVTATLANGASFTTNYRTGGTDSYLGLAFSGQSIVSLQILNGINSQEYMTINNFTAGAIGKTNASVVLENLSQTYDGKAKSATATTTPEGLAVDVTYDGNAQAPTRAGTYAVAATINDANYQGSASATLTVAKASAGVVLGNLSQTYNGSARSATATTTPAGLAIDVTYNGSSMAPTNVGTYNVIATINDSNYEGVASGNLVIAASAYQTWALDNSLSGIDADPSADPDKDGWSNALEFAFGLVPTSAAGQLLAVSGSGKKITFLQRGGVTYVVRSTADLAAGFTGTIMPEKSNPQPAGLPAGYEQFEALLPSDSTRGFSRIEVTVQP